MATPEMVRKPAVRIGPVVFSLVKPTTHHYEVYDQLAHLGLLPSEPCQTETGFLASDGKFISISNSLRTPNGDRNE